MIAFPNCVKWLRARIAVDPEGDSLTKDDTIVGNRYKGEDGKEYIDEFLVLEWVYINKDTFEIVGTPKANYHPNDNECLAIVFS